MKNFNRTLLKKISSPPQPLRDRCELINQTLRKLFSSGSAEIFPGPENSLRPSLKNN